MIEVRQLHPMFVGEVSGVDLAASLRRRRCASSTDAIDRYAVLVFHDQTLDDDRLLALGPAVRRRRAAAQPSRRAPPEARGACRHLQPRRQQPAARARRPPPPRCARQPALAFGRLLPRGAGRAVDAVRARRAAGRRRDRVRRPARRLRRACRPTMKAEDRRPGRRALDLPLARPARPHRLHGSRARRPADRAPQARAHASGLQAQDALHGRARLPHRSAGRCRRDGCCCAT